MPIRIGANITSLNVQRNLGDATAQLSKSMERLSSGLRINRASDDAAGLAISETLKSSSRVYTTAIRNVNDGISYLNIADGALAELANVSTRQLELSEQASNGSYSNVQRQALDAEADALVKEFNRIVKTTEFNGLKVLDVEESSGFVRVQAGYGINGSLGLSLGAQLSRYVGTGTFVRGVQYSAEGSETYDVKLADIDGDGDLDMVTAGYDISTSGQVTVRIKNGDGSFASAVQYTAEGQKSFSLQLADIDNDGDLDMITAGTGGSKGWATVRKNNGKGAFGAATQYSTEGERSSDLQLADVDNDGDLDMITAGRGADKGWATIRKNNGDGTFGVATQYSTEGELSFTLQLADIDNDGDLDMITAGYTDIGGSQFQGWASVRKNNGDGTFGERMQYSTERDSSSSVQLADIDGDGDLDMVTAGKGLSGVATIRKNNGDGTFGSATQYTMEEESTSSLSLSDIDGDGDLDMVTAGYNGKDSDGEITIRKNNGDGTFGAAVHYSAEQTDTHCMTIGDVDNDGVLDIVTGGYNEDDKGQVTFHLGAGHSVTTIASLNLSTQLDSRKAITVLQAQLNRISAERGNVGSAQSRLSVALNTLSTTRENFDAAASRITDIDVAQEASEMTRNEIVQRAASAVLANANTAPELALKLLQ